MEKPATSRPESQESQRLQSTFAYNILDTPNEQQLDELAVFTATIFNVPIALITILDENRQWFKSNFGLSRKETERSISFCQYTILQDNIFEVEDALKNETFKDNPLVTGDPFIRYYCGAPLTNEKGYNMGSLAIIDTVPRTLNAHQKKTLKLLADQVMNFFELNQKRSELLNEKKYLEKRVAERTRELEQKVIELKKRDEKIISVNNELNRLIYKASHDLLGPLRTLEGLLQLAQAEDNLNLIRDYLRLIHATEQKLEFVLVNLLKIVSIKDASDYQLIEWNSVFDHALKKIKERGTVKTVILNKRIKGQGEYYADPMLLEMIFEQLFANSIQYNANNPVSIEIEVQLAHQALLIKVTDNGIGIRDHEKEKIFEMFFKNPHSRGSGLGLYVARSAIEKLKGTITVKSVGNKGTTFTIILPPNSHS